MWVRLVCCSHVGLVCLSSRMLHLFLILPVSPQFSLCLNSTSFSTHCVLHFLYITYTEQEFPLWLCRLFRPPENQDIRAVPRQLFLNIFRSARVDSNISVTRTFTRYTRFFLYNIKEVRETPPCLTLGY